VILTHQTAVGRAGSEKQVGVNDVVRGVWRRSFTNHQG